MRHFFTYMQYIQKTKPFIVLTEEQKEMTLVDVLNGVPIGDTCKKLGISKRGFSYYCERDPNFAKDLAKMRVERAHELVAHLEKVTDGCETMVEVGLARIKSENIKWIASKVVPQQYGDTLNLNHNVHLDLSSVLQAAANRVISIKDLNPSVPNENKDVAEISTQVSSQGYESNDASEAVIESEVITENANDPPENIEDLF